MVDSTLHEQATVMIVDDMPASLGPIVEYLEAHGCRTAIAQDGAEALQRAEIVLPDLILMDILMPGMSGIEVCRQLKGRPDTADIPVLLMTALSEVQHKLDGFAAGAVDYLTKPLQIEEVAARVNTHLKLRLMQKRLEAKNAELQRYRDELEQRVAVRTAALSEEVAHRQHTESRLLNESLRLQTLLQAIPDPVWLKDPHGVYLAANAALARIIGVPDGAVVGCTDFDFFVPELAHFFRQRDHAVMSAGQTLTNEEWVPCPGTGQRLWETVKTPLRDETGAVVGVLGISHDITEHRRLQDELRAKEQYQRALLNNFPFMVWLKDTASRFLAVNQRFADAAGVDQVEEFFGKSDLDVWPEDLAQRYRADDAMILRTGEKKHIEEHIVDRGVRRWFETYKAPVVVDGRLLGTVGFARDITERKRGNLLEEARLRMFERLTAGVPLNEVLRPIVEYVEKTHPDLICSIMLLDEDGRRLRVGPASAYLSYEYLQAIDGLEIGPMVGACGAAVWRRQTVVTEDIRTHPNWTPYRELALNAKVQSCWSMPILDTWGVSLGTFGIYLRIPSSPTHDQLATVRLACEMAAIVIERKWAEEALHKREQEFRTLAEHSPDVVARLDPDCRYIYCNAQLEKVIGVPRALILGRRPVEIRDHAAVHQFQQKAGEALASGRETEIVHIVDLNNGDRRIHDHVRFVPEFDQSGQVVSVLVIGRDISALKETERQLSTLIDNIPDLVMRLDPEGRHLYVSPAVLRAFELSSRDFLGRTPVDISFSGDALGDAQIQEVVRKTASDGVPTMLTMTIHRLEKRRVFDFMYVPEHDEFGRVVSVLGVGRDISSLQAAQRELQQKQALLRSLIDSIPDLIFFKDRESRYLGFNKAFAAYCNSSEAQMIGKTDYEFAPREVAEFYRQKDREMLASGQSRNNDEWIIYPDGRKVLLDTRKTPLFGASGEIIGVIGVSRDITLRRQMEEDLQRREWEFRTLAEHSPDMIARYDRGCRHIYVNPAYARNTGIFIERIRDASLEQVWGRLLPCGEFRARVEQVVASGQSDRMLLEWGRPGGQITSHRMQMIAEHDEAGAVSGVLLIGHDITELKATERRLEKSRAQLRGMTRRREDAREEERKRIAREIHDELGQLLSVLRLNVTTLDYRFGEDNAELRLKAQKMVGTVDSAINVVRNLTARLRPAALSAGIVSALEWQVQEFGDHTELECQLHLPEGDIQLDEERATAVFRIAQESLTNILRHAEANRATISLRSLDNICELEVSDDGNGFDPNQVAGQSSFGIIGMRERALMLGGSLQIDSAIGQGTVLKLRIPIDGHMPEEAIEPI